MKFEKATKVKALIAMIVSILTGGVAAQTVKDARPVWKWSFDADRGGEPPSGFSFGRTGSGRVGRWVVRAEKDAPSGTNVLAQVDEDNPSYRFPIAVANEPSLQNFRLSVRCKPISGKVDQACGLVFRYRDENNYYVIRANALEDNVRFYYVKDGKRNQLASWSGRVSSGSWHELRVDARGEHLEVYWNGKRVIDAKDTTFSAPGKVGVWTKADSVTYFDDLSATPLPSGE
ncbi:MAG TPA: family 16 glycoside hydrolase [Candidatus Binatia bacterium]|jgi:hypothetical protein|nr:family 16 glycoside hydrolase [Candidatus Binatia bacterium]